MEQSASFFIIKAFFKVQSIIMLLSLNEGNDITPKNEVHKNMIYQKISASCQPYFAFADASSQANTKAFRFYFDLLILMDVVIFTTNPSGASCIGESTDEYYSHWTKMKKVMVL